MAFHEVVVPEPTKGGLPGFASFKTGHPIVYPMRFCRDALIQATLDERIDWIEPQAGTTSLPADALFSFLVTRGRTKTLVALCVRTETQGFRSESQGGYVQALSRRQILSEPMLSACRTIWSKRKVQVPVVFQVALLARLATRLEGMTLFEVSALQSADPERWVDFTCKLACQGLVQIHTTGLITPQTKITLGREAALLRASQAQSKYRII